MTENGIVIGIVVDLVDPEGIGRIKVKYPHLKDRESQWARLATLMAGPERGSFFRPEVEDEVLVGFLQGNPRFPYILGSLWSIPDKPPKDDGDAKANNWRFFRSRSGHVLKFDDTKGQEKVEIFGKDEKHHIVIDCTGDKIQIICDTGNLELSAPAGKVSIDAQEISLSSTANTTIKASGNLTLEGATVNIN